MKEIAREQYIAARARAEREKCAMAYASRHASSRYVGAHGQ